MAGVVRGEPRRRMLTDRTRLAVWGDPIAHSRSPRLHAAAYEVLGLDWHYGRERVDEAGFPAALSRLDADWRGLSLTMPLKHVAARSAVSLDDAAQLTSAVNTLLLVDGDEHGFNTDVGGLVRALSEQGIEYVDSARILGAGATATSALVALATAGARRIDIVARREGSVERLAQIGRQLKVDVVSRSFADPGRPAQVDVTIGALPGEVTVGDGILPYAENGGLLVDVVYGNWPTDLARRWEAAGNIAIDGLPMLLHQALLQVRVFVGGDPSRPVDREDAVLAAMRTALMGD